jgi:hypothetical protein
MRIKWGAGEGMTCLTDIALVLNPEMSAVDVLLQVSYNNKVVTKILTLLVSSSVPDPDTQVPLLFGPPGSEPVTKLMDPAPDADPSLYKHRN